MMARLILVAVLLGGCAGSTRDQIKRGLVAAHAAQQIATKAVDPICTTAREQCDAFGKPADCERLKQCLALWRGLELLLMAVEAIDRAVDALPLGEVPNAR